MAPTNLVVPRVSKADLVRHRLHLQSTTVAAMVYLVAVLAFVAVVEEDIRDTNNRQNRFAHIFPDGRVHLMVVHTINHHPSQKPPLAEVPYKLPTLTFRNRVALCR